MSVRPRIICHMISSVDGRLLVKRWSQPATGSDARDYMRHYERIADRLDADGWIVGRKTMAEVLGDSGETQTVANAASPRAPHIGAARGRSLAIAFDPSGKLRHDGDDIAGDHAVSVLGPDVSDAYLAKLRDAGISYFFAEGDLGMLHALEAIGREFDATTLLLEGGGIINGAFLKAGLIDEISIIVVPAIDGLSGSPSIFDHIGAPGEKPSDGLSLRHMTTKTLDGGAVWLRYRVEKSRTSQHHGLPATGADSKETMHV